MGDDGRWLDASAATSAHGSPASPAIAQHRLLSNARSAALIRPNAEIDWWCAPDMDSMPLLWSLLDQDGPAARWRGARMACRSEAPAGPCARTVLMVGTARLECWDGLLSVEGGGVALVRLLRSERGPVEVTHELSLAGFDGRRVEWSAGGRATVAGAPVWVTGGASEPDGHVLRTTLPATAGRWSALVVAVGGAVAAEEPMLAAQLAGAERHWSNSLRHSRLPRHHPERATDALAVLQSCTYADTGAVVAAVTTSLPEVPGADRQFDYRYTWLRDASLAVSVAALLGHRSAARAYLSFLHSVVGATGVTSRPVVDVRGGTVPDEREIPQLAGWEGSRPIRVGNRASGQVQYDGLGLVLEAVSVYLQTGGSLDGDTWHMVQAIADRLASSDDVMSNGIWEFRDRRALVSADIARWLGLDRAVWIARGWRPLTSRRTWRRARAAARRRVLDALRPDGALPQSYGEGPPSPDASALMAVIFGMLDARRDERAKRLVEWTIGQLEGWPYLYRYQPGASDGFEGHEGAFVPMSWWAVDALAAVGRLEEARSRVDAMCARLPRLMSEEIDPESGMSLGNTPLVWSHMEAARTMYLLDAATLRHRWGAAALWTWRIGRYLGLRFSPPPGDSEPLPVLPAMDAAEEDGSGPCSWTMARSSSSRKPIGSRRP